MDWLRKYKGERNFQTTDILPNTFPSDGLEIELFFVKNKKKTAFQNKRYAKLF